jgi:tetratricopeptide (TPR) repeat protein
VYFAITVGGDNYLKLEKFFQLEGLAYRLVPVNGRSHDGQTGRIATDIMYENLINKFQWGGVADTNVYLDENNLRMTMNLRNNFARLATAFVLEGKNDKAIEVLDKCLEVMPEKTVPYNMFIIGVAEGYYSAKAVDKADEIMLKLLDNTKQELDYFLSLPDEYRKSVVNDAQRDMAIMQEISNISNKYKSLKEVHRSLIVEVENRILKDNTSFVCIEL